MLTFKQFLAEMVVTASKRGNAISSRVLDPHTGKLDAKSIRHIKNYVLPAGGADTQGVESIMSSPADHRIDMVPTHTHVLQGTDQHVAVFGISRDTVGGKLHYHAHVRPATEEGYVDMSAPEQRIQLNKLSKPKGVKNTLRAEEEMLSNLNSRLQAIKETHGLTHVPIVVGNDTYHVSHFASTPGTPKSDVYSIHGETADANHTLHLSLKAGKHPKDVQQYGGVSHPKIAIHPEVRQFLKDVYHYTAGKLTKGQHINRPIKDPHLKSMMVFGHNHGASSFGIDNVQAFIQGDIKPVPHPTLPGHWMLQASHIIYNHEPIEGDHDPVLAARFQSDRHTLIPRGSDLGINEINQKGTAVLARSRVGAFPLGGIPSKSETI